MPLQQFLTRAKGVHRAAVRRLVVVATLAAILPATARAHESPAVINPRDFGAQGDGVADDTKPLRSAIAAAVQTGKIVLLPPGIYLTEPLNLGIGQIIRGSGEHTTILQSLSGRTVLEVTSTGSPRSQGGFVYGIEIADLGIRGVAQPWYPGAPYTIGETVQNASAVYECTQAGQSGRGPGPGGVGGVVDGTVRWKWLRAVERGGHGIHFHDNGRYGGPASIEIRNVYVSNIAGDGILMEEEWCTTLENVDVDKAGGNGIDLQGGNTTTLLRCYVHQVGPGRAGYRVHGSAALISCNGVDNPKEQASIDWAVFGDSVKEGDSRWSYASPTLMNCNVEDFSGRGIYLKEGGSAWIQGGAFIAPAVGEVRAIVAAWSSDASAILSGQVKFMTKGARWANGAAIHSLAGGASPVLQIGGANAAGEPVSYYAHSLRGSAHVPTISGHFAGYIDGVPRAAVRLSAAVLDDVLGVRIKGRRIDVASAPPTEGESGLGDIVWNAEPKAGAPAGWVCVAAGKPGVWKAMARLEE